MRIRLILMAYSLFSFNKCKLMREILLLLFIPICTMAQTPDYQKAEGFFDQKKFNEAKPLFESFLKNHPKDQKTLEYLGDIASYNSNWDTAMGYYEVLVEEDGQNANYHYKYGGALGMKALSISRLRAVTYIGDIKEQFITAAELDPDHIETRWALIELYLQLPGILGGSESKAKNYASELQKISPIDGYLSKGYIEEREGRQEEAEKYYKEAIALGGSPVSYEKLTNLYEKNDRPEDALRNAQKSLKLHKRNQLNYQIGKISAEYNMEPQLGIDCLKRYIENHSYKDGVPKTWAYYRLAQIYKNLGDKNKALDYVNRAITVNPDFEEAIKIRTSIRSL